ncbi:pyridoxal phosphate-dependent aminotransferase [Brevundimonas sp.]|uniref:pyridoxal phosphate-dependent aminotransferase n=1 Tax=Brevundimonas sp. TaxID=1871086 RepID=UPI0025C3B625|nr:pyridoxal phosphate-dependent aminotransferase [Brevundimonas sp.]
MTARQDDAPLYAGASYSAWARDLYRRMPLPKSSLLVFESTVEEPVHLLADLVSRAFSGGPPDRYESVFGRGNPHLLAALAARYGVAGRSILAVTGVSSGMAQVLNTLVSPGDHVLVERPGFDVLSSLAHAAWCKVTDLARPAPDFDLTAADLRRALRPDTRMVIISNLHNPSGRLLDEQRVLELAAAAAEVGAWLVVDEVYADFARADAIRLQTAPNLLRINSLSKVFGLYALRCGWIIADPEVIARVAAANAGLEFGVSKLTHAVAAMVLEDSGAFEDHWRGVLAAGRPVLARHMAAMASDGLIEGEAPPFGCMAFPRVVGHPDTLRLAESLWREDGLVTAPGEMFGRAGHMRLGFGLSPAALDEGLSRLHESLRRRRGVSPEG